MVNMKGRDGVTVTSGIILPVAASLTLIEAGSIIKPGSGKMWIVTFKPGRPDDTFIPEESRISGTMRPLLIFLSADTV
jgi:hypothetical protein